MDAENRTATREIITHSDKCVNCSFVVSDRVRELFEDASANHNLDGILLTNAELNRSILGSEPKPAPIHAGIAYHQSGNLWTAIYRYAIQNTELTVEERAFMYCLRYMLIVESMYSQIVDRVCYMLMWRTKPPTLGNLERWYNEGDTVHDLQRCSLAAKLKYLTENGFGYLADACDVELRNAVAHMTLTIDGPVHHSSTDKQVRNGVSIEGVNVRIKRRAENGTYVSEKVDVKEALFRLEKEVTSYVVAFERYKEMC